MELHSKPAIGKKLWNILRVAFFMMRKGLISKRKLIMDMNLMMKRGKVLKKSFSNLMSHHHHHHHHHHSKNGHFGNIHHHYEFSCTNSPNLMSLQSRKRKHHYFPCLNLPNVEQEDEEEEEEEAQKSVIVMPKMEYYSGDQYSYNNNLTPDATSGEKSMSPWKASPFSVRVSNFSMLEEENDDTDKQVDNDAEDFIRRFYEQLRIQSRTQLLEYEEMLDRGTN